MKKLLLFLAFVPAFLIAQSRKEKKALAAQQKLDQQLILNLKNHIQHLADDRSASIQEYISNEFKTLKLQPGGINGFIQHFEVDKGKKIEPTSYLKVDNIPLELNKDFFPLSFSAEKKVSGMPAMALRERGVPWFFDLKDWFDDGSKMSQSMIEEAVKKEIMRVSGKGASALFIYNSGSVHDSLYFNPKDNSTKFSIPVIYITSEGYRKYFTDHSAILDIELNVVFGKNISEGDNIIGYLDNAANSTVVISAHYRPFFKSSGALSVNTPDKQVLGVDDNASGVALLIELARMLGASSAKHNNYLFIAFDGNDKGLLGGNFWIENHPSITPINYLVNLDMLGSFKEGKILFVQGTNTSPLWKDLMMAIGEKKLAISIDTVSLITDIPMVFYQRGIPELSFSAGSHENYTTISNDETTLNYAGTVEIARFISRIVEAVDSKGKVTFAKVSEPTKPEVKGSEQSLDVAAKYTELPSIISKTSVSLGLIPDKTKSELGLKINGVSPKKLAAKIGLQPGDVLTNLGSYKISDLKSYMFALSQFKIGDRTTLRIKRGKDDKEFAVEF